MLKLSDSKLTMYVKLNEHRILAHTWAFEPREKILTWKDKVNRGKQIYFN